MKPITLILAGIAAVFLSMTSWLCADQIKLKDGTTMDGIINSEDDKEVKIEVELSGGRIRTTRAVSKADIETITRSSTTEKAETLARRELLDVQRYKLDPEKSYPLDYYDRAIKEVFQPYWNRYSNTTSAAAVKSLIADWQAERDMVATGQAKLHGKWMPTAVAHEMELRETADKMLAAGRAFITEKNWDAAIQQLQPLLATNIPPEVSQAARPALANAYQQLSIVLEQQTKQLDAQIAALRPQTEQAKADLANKQAELQKVMAAGAGFKESETQYTFRNPNQNYPNQQQGRTMGQVDTSGPKLGEYSKKIVGAKSAFDTAKSRLTAIQTDMAQLDSQLQAAKARISRMKSATDALNITLASVSTNAIATITNAVPVPPQTGSGYEEEASEAGKSWLQKYWLYGVIGIVVVLWLLTKLTKR